MQESLNAYILSHFDDALNRRYIQVYYQPVIRTISGQLCSFEALARWQDPVRGLLRPDQFIPVLECEKRIHELDSYITYEVCRQIRQTIDSGATPIPVSINLSRMDFTYCDIYEIVENSVSAFQIPHDYLYIEITESVLAEEETLMHEIVDRFQAAGFQVWMDDFGSGYSSLNMLKDYSFNELKLDIRFLSSFNQRSRRILTSVIQMAKELGIHTLAEGVETEEQFQYLRNIGCEKVQGYYFGKPLPYPEALEHLHKTGITVEPPRDRRYYDDIGRVNVLSPAPFLSQAERRRLVTGRQLNSIPLAIAEIRRDSFSLLFSNDAFEQNINGIGLFPELFNPEKAGSSFSLSIIPVRVLELLESTRSQGEGRMHFVSHKDYYELRVKCIARRRDAFSVLMQLNNLSETAHAASTSHLDEGLRQIYTLFTRITLIDLKKDRITPLYVGLMDYLTAGNENLAEIIRDFASRRVFCEDQERYLRFMDLSTLEERIGNTGLNSVAGFFRCLVNDGKYEWKQIILLRYRPGTLLELMRDAHAELEAFRLRDPLSDASSGSYPPELLWNNLIRSSIVRLFWKDRDRRFLGVSQSFLDYYGFSSPRDVIGKTDEDLGWHVHPDLYMNDELRVIHEGITTHNIPGRCICAGENREILANKTPLYSDAGDIVGLLGCFIDKELLIANDVRGSDTAIRDDMTGLLNSRGIYEQIHAFQDEYYLRNTDFMRLHVAIDDIASLNNQYGFDFGDKVITALGRELKKVFGVSSAVGRLSGYQFVVLHQIRERSDLLGLRSTVRRIADSIREIDGTPITLYLSIGYSLYSEFENLDELTQSAEMRLLADHDEHVSIENRQSRSSDFFRLYDNLPISYAVYKVHADPSRNVTDATLFYANNLFGQRAGRPVQELIGQSVRDLWPEMDSNWYDMAARAALLGETIVDTMYFEATNMRYYMTVTQVIRPGYCSFTYQELDGNGKPVEPTAN